MISMLTEHVYMLNQHSIAATKMIAKFKAKLKNDVLRCTIFTTAYPLLIDHIFIEALQLLWLLWCAGKSQTYDQLVRKLAF
jgi:hypothetical protein